MTHFLSKLTLAFLFASVAVPIVEAAQGDMEREFAFAPAFGVQHNVPSDRVSILHAWYHNSDSLNNAALEITISDGCVDTPLPRLSLSFGPQTRQSLVLPLMPSDCYWLNRSDTDLSLQTQVIWLNTTQESFEGQSHANETRVEMNETRTEQNDIQNATRTAQNDIQNATRTAQNDIQNATRTAQNDIQNATRTAQNDIQNATSLSTFETQAHVNATYCKLNESSQLCRGNFLGEFAGNYSGVGIPNTTALNQTADHLLQMESSDLDNPNVGELYDEKGATWFYDGLATGPSFRDNIGTIDFTSGYAQTSECALTGHVESFSIGGWIPDPDLPANGRLFNTSAGAGSSGNVDEFIITYLENTNVLRFNLGGLGGTVLSYNSHGSGPFHVFLTFDNSTKLVKTYRNGTLVEQHSTVGSEDDGIYFGNAGQCWFSTPETNAGNRYQGTLAQWRIYEGKALTTTEIDALASGTWGEPGLIDYIARMPDTYRGGNFTGTFDIDSLVGDFSGTFTGTMAGNLTGNFTGNATMDEFEVLGTVTLVTAADEWIPIGIWMTLLIFFLYYVAWAPAFGALVGLASVLREPDYLPTSATVMLFTILFALHVLATRTIIPAKWGAKGGLGNREDK